MDKILVYNTLVDELNKYSDRYYNHNESLISDIEFDIKMKQLNDLEKELDIKYLREDSPTNKVGFASNEDKIKHSVKMLSLDNTYNPDELSGWLEKITNKYGNIGFCVEKKYDGVSLSVEYDNKGNLIRLITRGNGDYGEDVTRNINGISNIPSQINKGPLIVRGEVVMTKDVYLHAVNSNIEYSNTRNAASGLLRLKQDISTYIPNIEKPLHFIPYFVIGDNIKSQYHSLQELENIGFFINDIYKSELLESKDVFTFIEDTRLIRYELPIDIDGMVIKVDNKSLWEELGETSKFPRWATSFKFPARTEWTTLRKVDFQMSRNGVLTPVAIFDPIFIQGVKIEKCSLNNVEFMEEKDLIHDNKIYIGAKISIKRAGEVIPVLDGVIFESETLTPIDVPSKCPFCGSDLVRDGKKLICPNKQCKERNIMELTYICGKSVLDIKGMGESVIRRLEEEFNFITSNSIRDIISLKNTEFPLGKFYFNLKESLCNAFKKDLYRQILALCIPGVGSSVAKKIADDINILEDFLDARYIRDILVKLNLGPVVTENILSYIKESLEYKGNECDIMMISKESSLKE